MAKKKNTKLVGNGRHGRAVVPQVGLVIRVDEGKAATPGVKLVAGHPETRVVAKFAPPFPSPRELRKLPMALQEAILAASAELAEQEYRTNRALTAFEAFAEED